MMELQTSMAVRDLVHAIWSMAVGSVLGTSHVVAVAWWLERRCHQRWQQEQEARERLRALDDQARGVSPLGPPPRARRYQAGPAGETAERRPGRRQRPVWRA